VGGSESVSITPARKRTIIRPTLIKIPSYGAAQGGGDFSALMGNRGEGRGDRVVRY